MEKFIAARAQEGVSKGDILSIASEAKKDRLAGNKVIDASIGVLLNDDKTLNGVEIIRDSLKNHIDDNLAYPPIKGYEEYKTAVLTWLLKDKYETITSEYEVPFCATLGGTGACFISFSTFLDENSKVLLPSPMWGNYTQIGTKAGVGYETYALFNADNGFNISGLEEKIEELGIRQGRVLVVINDPCQNPTGYCLNKKEYAELFKMLNREGKKYTLTVLFDIAYLDYDCPLDEVHAMFLSSTKEELSFLPCFAFSCSKTFGIYGLRCGALFAFTKEKEVKDGLERSFASYARGTYSCPNGPALLAVAQAVKDKKKSSLLHSSISSNALLLQKRGKLLRELLEEEKIVYLPYINGFFLTIVVKDAYKTFEDLKLLHSYVVPLNKAQIRLALSGLNDEEMKMLVKQIKGAN